MHKQLLPLVALCALTLSSCHKDPDTTPPPSSTATKKYFAKTIEWSYGGKGTIHYNADSTIDNIAYEHDGTAGYTVDYTWNAKQLTEMAVSSSLYKNTFAYSNGLMSNMINEYKEIANPVGYKFEFSYDAGKRLTELKYFQVNELGTNLKTTSTYTYSSGGDLQSINTVQANSDFSIIYTIDSWSAECEIHPWLFVSANLGEYYQIYNYPVISSLKKLPGKMTKSIQQLGHAAVVDKITEQSYEISNKRLDKINTTFSYPAHPELNQTQWTQFKY